MIGASLNMGVTGAKRAIFKMKGPLRIMASVLKQYPTYTEREQEVLWDDRLTEAELPIIKHYYWVNNRRSLMRAPRKSVRPFTQDQNKGPSPTAVSKAESQKDVNEREAGMNERYERLAQLAFEITFGECAVVGGWYAKLAGMGAPDQKVGDVLTLEQVKAVFST